VAVTGSISTRVPAAVAASSRSWPIRTDQVVDRLTRDLGADDGTAHVSGAYDASPLTPDFLQRGHYFAE
jgi:hypothetical protein